ALRADPVRDLRAAEASLEDRNLSSFRRTSRSQSGLPGALLGACGCCLLEGGYLSFYRAEGDCVSRRQHPQVILVRGVHETGFGRVKLKRLALGVADLVLDLLKVAPARRAPRCLPRVCADAHSGAVRSQQTVLQRLRPSPCRDTTLPN